MAHEPIIKTLIRSKQAIVESLKRRYWLCQKLFHKAQRHKFTLMIRNTEEKSGVGYNHVLLKVITLKLFLITLFQ